jgi:F-type H+-transporting ATPase subunit gamma
MAGLSTKAIKNRIKSMNSTRQITKAMELVAASKLRGAQARAVAIKEYFTTFYQAMQDIAASSSNFESKFLSPTPGVKPLYIVIAGDRGLAGGYNSNVFRMTIGMPPEAKVIPIGKRSVEFFKKRRYEIVTDDYIEAAILNTADCYSIAALAAEGFLKGEYDSLFVIYTNFINLLSQSTERLQLLPFNLEEKEGPRSEKVLYEPDAETVFERIVPEYLGGLIFGALSKSIASEQAARRQAMNSATKNADEIIAELDLQYNRARQGAITQEITEIVAGSNAQS